MKKLIIFSIELYQKILSQIFKNILGTKVFCKSSPSCSEYARRALLRYGILKGGYFSLKRIINCR